MVENERLNNILVNFEKIRKLKTNLTLLNKLIDSKTDVNIQHIEKLPTGVRRNTNNKRFFAIINHNQKPYNLGTYDTPEEEHQVYLK